MVDPLSDDAASTGKESEGTNISPNIDFEMLRLFLESLSPGQMSMLILSGALDDILGSTDEGELNIEQLSSRPPERQGFDYEEWEKRLGLKIR